MPQKPSPQHEPAAKQRGCLAHALRLLGRRALTGQGLQDTLTEEGFAPQDIGEAMAQLRTWGYINDERLGDSVVAAAVRRKKGPAWLRQQLKSRKVPGDIANRCVDTLQDDAQALAQEILARRFGAEQLAEPRTALRALRLLQRRGFDGSTCRKALAWAQATKGRAHDELPSTFEMDDAP